MDRRQGYSAAIGLIARSCRSCSSTLSSGRYSGTSALSAATIAPRSRALTALSIAAKWAATVAGSLRLDRVARPRDRRFAQVLAAIFEGFLEPLARAQSREGDLDLAIRLQSGEADHAARQIHDFDGLAHVEHVGRRGLGGLGAERRGHQHERHRLADGHEVALDVGVGDRDRPPWVSCSVNSGITDPLDPSTLPKRTVRNACAGRPRASGGRLRPNRARRPASWRPRIDTGLTALSVEMNTAQRASTASAASATVRVASAFVLAAPPRAPPRCRRA
jgi:hypothetical protein